MESFPPPRRALAHALPLLLLAFPLPTTVRAFDVLFVGNSFTHGDRAPVIRYNASAITDLNGLGYGGVPGIFKKLADEGGFTDVRVSIEAISGQTLAYHYANQKSKIGRRWDAVVFQEYSTGTLVTHPSGDLAGFRQAVQNLAALVRAQNPAVKIALYETWARPDLVPSAYYPTLQSMQNEIRAAYSAAATDFGLHAWVPVGGAFMRMVDERLAYDPASVPAGQVTLWASDQYHANDYGSYLSALLFYTKLLGGDPRALPTGSGSAVAGLGLDAARAVQIQRIARRLTADPASPDIDRQPASLIVFAGSSARFTVEAYGEQLACQWLHNEVPVPGATAPTLVLASVDSADTGVYQVRLSDSSGRVLLSDAVTLTLATRRATRSWCVDFGSAAAGFPAPSPDAGGRYWNNFTGNSAGASLSPVRLSDGAAHPTASILLPAAFSGINSNGPTTGVSPYPAETRRDSFHVTGSGTIGSVRGASVRFAGLNPAARYDFTLFAGRSGVSSRFTRYTLGALPPVFLQAADNLADTVAITGAAPSATGLLDLVVEPYDSAGALQEYGYLNLVAVTEFYPVASAYALWASRHMLPPFAAGAAADPDADGLPNLFEFALGRDPAASDAGGVEAPLSAQLGADGRLVLDVIRVPEAAELSFVVEVSSDLVTWRSGPAYTTVEIDAPSRLRVRDNTRPGPGAARFIRLQLAEQAHDASDF